MITSKNTLTSVLILLVTKLVFCQGLPLETVAREINRQIFDIDGQLPGFYTLTNKYHKFYYGRIKREVAAYPDDEKVIREFNAEGRMTRYQVYRKGRLNDDFSFEYADNGISLLKERGTYNLDYFQMDSVSFFGVPALGNGNGFNYNLDTLFVHETKLRYDLIRKKKSPLKTVDRYIKLYTNDGYLLRVTIFKNNVQTGHITNRYNSMKQVTERQDFWNYRFFANEDEWIEYLANRIYKFSYNSNGIIKTLTTEIYNPIERKWEVQSQDFDCSIEFLDSLYHGKCACSGEDYLNLTLDSYGNWILKEEYKNGKTMVSTRNLEYYD